MKLRSTFIFSGMLALTLTSGAALAQQSLAAHQHGQAELQIAISGEHVEALLLSPAYNLLGFEHRPETPEQHHEVDAIARWLEQTAIVNTVGGLCSPVTSSLHTNWGHEQMHESGAAHPHDHHHDDTQDDESGHSDVEVVQSLRCPGLKNSEQFETNLMARFPALEQLHVQWVGPQGQGSVRLNQGEARFYPGR
ncbi:DUF2796 domain-containing protein [Marinobacter sp.]|uniref:ZrgA family zinc uptake protein n=1 Tax=Marinobacter sp. TaxID=50741 RepID=UPI0035636D22